MLDTFFLTRRSYAKRRSLPTKDDIHFVELSLATVRARVAGKGQRTLVIVLDPPNTIEHYTELIARLISEFRVVFFEATGFGFSFPKTGFKFTLSERAQVVIELLEQLNVRAAVLSFPCLEAFVALMVAERRPELVEKLLLIQVPSYIEAKHWTRRTDILNVIKTPSLGQVATSLGKNLLAREWYRSALPRSADITPYLNSALDSFKHGACFCLSSAFQTFQQEEEPVFSAIEKETIVLWGTADSTHTQTDKKSLLAYVPHVRWIEFKHCGHFPDFLNPEEYIRLLKQ